jgi:hypothetical protein
MFGSSLHRDLRHQDCELVARAPSKRVYKYTSLLLVSSSFLSINYYTLQSITQPNQPTINMSGTTQSHATGGSKGRLHSTLSLPPSLTCHSVPDAVQQNAPKEVENALPNAVSDSVSHSRDS